MKESKVRCRREIGAKAKYYILKKEEKRKEGAKKVGNKVTQ
jgi:hypothetical protein